MASVSGRDGNEAGVASVSGRDGNEVGVASVSGRDGNEAGVPGWYIIPKTRGNYPVL